MCGLRCWCLWVWVSDHPITGSSDHRILLMRIAYLECFSGISGDMFLGALLDAGVPLQLFTRTVEALGVDARLELSRVQRSGISAVKLDVLIDGEKELPREEFLEKHAHTHHDQGHSHEQTHHGDRDQDRHDHDLHDHQHTAHDHDHSNERDQHDHTHGDHEHGGRHSDSHDHAHSHSHQRGLKEIRQIINAAAISATAKERAIRIFEALGAAEAKIHNTDIEKIH